MWTNSIQQSLTREEGRIRKLIPVRSFDIAWNLSSERGQWWHPRSECTGRNSISESWLCRRLFLNRFRIDERFGVTITGFDYTDKLSSTELRTSNYTWYAPFSLSYFSGSPETSCFCNCSLKLIKLRQSDGPRQLQETSFSYEPMPSWASSLRMPFFSSRRTEPHRWW